MSPQTKRLLNWVGSGLAIAGVAFVAIRLHEYGAELELGQIGWIQWATLGGMALIYGASGLLLAMAWRQILVRLQLTVSLPWAIHVYGVAQIAKYVPGNIFHLAGRQGMGMAAGLPAWPLAKSTVWEHALLAVAAAIFAILIAPLLLSWFPEVLALWVWCGGVLAAIWLMRWIFGRPAMRAFLLYVIFLVISGLLFVGAYALVSPELPANWIVMAGGYVIAWLIGMAAPGAPAGVGVREFVLLALFPAENFQSDLLMAVILGRVVTVLGDLSLYLFSRMVRK